MDGKQKDRSLRLLPFISFSFATPWWIRINSPPNYFSLVKQPVQRHRTCQEESIIRHHHNAHLSVKREGVGRGGGVILSWPIYPNRLNPPSLPTPHSLTSRHPHLKPYVLAFRICSLSQKSAFCTLFKEGLDHVLCFLFLDKNWKWLKICESCLSERNLGDNITGLCESYMSFCFILLAIPCPSNKVYKACGSSEENTCKSG